jgi:hypothetical protein
MQLQKYGFCNYHPKGYELNPEITKDSKLNTIKTKPLKTLILFTKTGVIILNTDKLQILIQTGP